MDERSFITWLKDNHLFRAVHDNSLFFKKILSENLGVKKNSFLLIAGDLGEARARVPAMMMGCYLLAAKRLGYQYILVFQKPKKRGMSACRELISAMSHLPPKGYLTLSLSGKLGSMKSLGKSFRKYIRHNDHRFLSTTGLAELPTFMFSKLVRTMTVDYAAMERKGEKLKRMLDAAKMVRIITDAGTNLKISVDGCTAIANTGVYPNFGGNIPGGEVYIPPKKNQVEGTLIIDGSAKIQNGTLLIKDPIRVRIKEGRIVSIEGKKEARALKETLAEAEKRAKYPWGIRRVGELGIGLNPNAGMIGPTIINEKTLGTAHIAFGSNAWFGGSIYAITHLDQVFLNPKIWVDGKRVIVR
jgi:hypothetical protein